LQTCANKREAIFELISPSSSACVSCRAVSLSSIALCSSATAYVACIREVFSNRHTLVSICIDAHLRLCLESPLFQEIAILGLQVAHECV